MKSNKKGFTLVGVMIVVVAIALFMIILSELNRLNKIDSAARDVAEKQLGAMDTTLDSEFVEDSNFPSDHIVKVTFHRPSDKYSDPEHIALINKDEVVQLDGNPYPAKGAHIIAPTTY